MASLTKSSSKSKVLTSSNDSNKYEIVSTLEGIDYNTKSALYTMYTIHTMMIDKLHPYCLLTSIKQQLGGYRDCVEKGANPDTIPPMTLSQGDEFYKWEAWRDCTCILTKEAWTPNKFKDAAIKKYISIARKYLAKLHF
jgi:hypothetical protein